MSGDNYTIACPKCHTVNAVRGRAMTLAMTCSKCRVYFRTGPWDKSVTTFHESGAPALPIGSTGTIDGTVYSLMGFVIKMDQKYRFYWREYLLFNPMKGYAFLSEYNGHWNFIWPIEANPGRRLPSDEFFYSDDTIFQLYQKSRAEVAYAVGEFFFDVVDMTKNTETHEYICPPHLYGVEQSDDSLLWFQGEYISPLEVANAFKVSVATLPAKEGVGYTEPKQNPRLEKIMLPAAIVVLLIAGFIELMLLSSAGNKTVYEGTFRTQDLKEQKVFVSPSFSLEDSRKNLEVKIYVPLADDWFFAEFSLVNEATGDEYNFTKEVSYYSGIEDGYRWTEGSTSGEALLSAIPGGRYHLNIYPELSTHDHEINVLLKRDKLTGTNFFVTALALILYPVIFYMRRRRFERKRWEESDYSPYHTEE